MQFQIGFVFLVSISMSRFNGQKLSYYSRGLFHEVFYSMKVSISNLRSSLVYPKVSSYYSIITIIDVSSSMNNYCQRVRGWFVTPQRGDHVFYTSCDDICQFYLSDDNDPSNIHLLVSQPSWVNHNSWTTYTSQTSFPIPLKANQSYYMEIVMYNSGGPGYMSLAVKMPNNTFIGPISNYLLGFLKMCSHICSSTKLEKCVYVNTSFAICTCEDGYSAINNTCQDIDECSDLTYSCFPNSKCVNTDGSYKCSCNSFWKLADGSQSCVDIDECADGTHKCYGDKINCINTMEGYNCSCDNECWVLRSDIQGQICEEKITTDLNCKPNLNVSFRGSLEGKLLTFSLEIHHLTDSLVNAYNVSFEYFIPSYVSVSSKSDLEGFKSIMLSQFKYILKETFTFNSSFIQNVNATIHNEICLYEVFTIEVPVKVTFQSLGKKTWSLFKSYQNKVSVTNCKSLKINKDPLGLPENYGRGIFWDKSSSFVYVCKSQHVMSTEAACYFSNDDGHSWEASDLRLGSVLGHHLLTNELYAIHRNHKMYLTFSKDYQKWIALTNEEFFKNVSKYIDYNYLKSLENDEYQLITLGSKQWMGNETGLFFRNASNETWLQKVKW